MEATEQIDIPSSMSSGEVVGKIREITQGYVKSDRRFPDYNFITPNTVAKLSIRGRLVEISYGRPMANWAIGITVGKQEAHGKVVWDICSKRSKCVHSFQALDEYLKELKNG